MRQGDISQYLVVCVDIRHDAGAEDVDSLPEMQKVRRDTNSSLIFAWINPSVVDQPKDYTDLQQSSHEANEGSTGS